jgi:hypothetical protein
VESTETREDGVLGDSRLKSGEYGYGRMSVTSGGSVAQKLRT